MKKDQYFNVEVNFLSDDNVLGMMGEMYSAEGLGIYMMLLLHLRTKDNYEASCQLMAMKSLARRNEVPLETMLHVLRDFGLFEVDEERQMFRSHYLDRVMKRLEERWRQNQLNGKKGGRPPKHHKTSETPASKAQKPNETQEKIREEKRSITTVNSNSSNTPLPVVASAAVAEISGAGAEIDGAVVEVAGAGAEIDGAVAEVAGAGAEIDGAVAEVSGTGTEVAAVIVVAPPVPDPPAGMSIRSIDEEGQCPLQAVHSWEKLVRQLPTSREYMEVAGIHSGLGQLFLDHQERIIELFADHIRLYDKGGQLLFFEDVKRYFSNYIAANSVTCRIVRDTLLAEFQQTKKKDAYCFETRIDGQRTYFGNVIPQDAPPRPDAAAVWDGVKKRWVH